MYDTNDSSRRGTIEILRMFWIILELGFQHPVNHDGMIFRGAYENKQRGESELTHSLSIRKTGCEQRVFNILRMYVQFPSTVLLWEQSLVTQKKGISVEDQIIQVPLLHTLMILLVLVVQSFVREGTVLMVPAVLL